MARPDRGHPFDSATSSPVWLALILSLGLILCASLARAEGISTEGDAAAHGADLAPDQDIEGALPTDQAPVTHDATQVTATLSGTVEPCLLPHGKPEVYRATLRGVGWSDIPEADRPAAIDRLMRMWLPITGQVEGSWADHIAHIPQALAFWSGFAANRTLMQRDDQVLALAGIAETDATLRVECWIAGGRSQVTDYFFDLVGPVYENQGVKITQIGVPLSDSMPETDYLLIRLTPPAELAAEIPGGDGMRTGITFPFPAN
jgi:hypothetical protein